ncbi:putative transporter [Sulfobacillus acidophilus TPY]|uniref:Transporter n=1 Tax=Sulfobacillus acidophilus (strain ATCC 700253 / DSM 10332 / NAL) TaxID=679936 RepID=G8TUY7_SULAD|nr:putative transporter [Sulfobacillus acidophilus TPY]AEW06952.1 hypothetical protein Sulac_3515 [Sulfobacillus acidophilus DSM 10332]
MKSSWLPAALVYTGTVIGAGFASGQEIWQFFARHGTWGAAPALLVTGAVLALLSWLAMETGRHDPSLTIDKLLKNTYPTWAVPVLDAVVLGFLVIGVAVVGAGGGTALNHLIRWPVGLGAFITIMATLVVVERGTNAVKWVNTLLLPFLIVLTLFVSYRTWEWTAQPIPVSSPHEWMLSALTYLSYNIFTAMAVLMALGRAMPSPRASLKAALTGTGILVVLAAAEVHALLRLETVRDLPMVDLATLIGRQWGRLYAMSLWVALFTTGVGEALAIRTHYGRRWLWALVLVVPAAGLPFGQLVARLYPVMGAVSLLLWLPLIVNRSKPLREG